MPYQSDGTGFNKNSYTSWLAAQKQKGKRDTQVLRILGLFVVGYGVWRQGCLGICSWHVKTAFSDMFNNGHTSAWTARLADMAQPGRPAEQRLLKLQDHEGHHEKWTDPEGVERVLYFRYADCDMRTPVVQRCLF
jgi:hypothetical protein